MSGYVPAARPDDVETENVDDPDPPAIDVGEKLTLIPAGAPDAESDTVEENPFRGVTVTEVVPEAPAATERVDGFAERVKSAEGPAPATAFTAAYAFNFPAPQVFGSGFVLV